MNACPRCGAAHNPRLEYCLECGQPLRPPSRPQRWRERSGAGAAWPVLAVLLLAALGALVAIAVSKGNDGTTTLVATRLPARTTVPKPPIFGTETVVPTILPLVTTTAAPTTTAPTQTTLFRWTAADAYTLVLASIPRGNGRASAVQIAKRALEQGLLGVGILDSKDFSGLQPGFFVVFAGVFQTNAAAAAHIAEAQRAGFAATYARRVTR